MAGFKVELQTAGPHVVGDLGITLTGAIGTIVDLTSNSPENVARSTDLSGLVSSGDILVVDTRDDSDATIMSMADSLEAIENHNDTHFGISGGRFGPLDDPTVTIDDDYIVQYDSGTDTYESQNPETLLQDFSDTIGTIAGGMGKDGTDTTFSYDPTCNIIIAGQTEANYDAATNNGTFFGGAGYAALDTITLSDAPGSVITVDAVAAGVVTAFTVTSSAQVDVTDGVALTQASTSGGGAGFTLTPEKNNTSEGCVEWSVDDVFLRNTGDTLDSGTLTIASGATVDFPTGSSLTIAGDVTAATIITPAGGFTGATDLINKEYVDSLAGGFDYKESVRAGTTPADGDITAGLFGGTYAAGGGPTGTGEFTGVDLSSGTGDTIDGINFTGVSSTGFVVGDRILIKDQTDATQNGIYEITSGPATSATLTRAEDQDGSPSSEVSGGNTTFVEDTTAINASSVNSNTRWSVVFDGEITLNTDDVDWTQTGGDGSTTDGIGISRNGNILDLDVDDLVAATPVGTDVFAFHDADGVAETSGSITRKVTFTDMFNALDVVNGITANGIIVRTADDTYASRTIMVEGAGNLDGLVVSDGDGVSGDPTIGLDIQNLPARSTAIDTTDRVPVWRADGTDANEYYTIAEIAGAVSASDSFSTWARSTAGGGGGSGGPLVADSSADTVTLDAGVGIDLDMVAGTDTVTFSFTDSGMADTAVVAADTVPFFDGGAGGDPEYRAWSDIITDLGLLTSGNQVVFTSVTGDSGTATADTNADTISLTGATSGGITTVASDGPENVTFAITGADLATGGATLATGDFIIVNDSADAATTVSLKYTFGTMITDLGLLTSGNQTVFTTVTGDSGTATADDNADNLQLEGSLNGGITTIATDGPELVTFGITPIDLTVGAATLALGDFIMVSDASDTVTTQALRYTFTDVVEDLDIVHGITGNGVIVRTAADTYTNRTITAASGEDLLGIDVTDGDGVSGDPTIGLDIVGLTDPGDDMATTDEFPVHDKSEGTGGANRKMTGQNIADGVAAILDIATLTFDTFPAVTSPADDQTLLAYTDSDRSKVLSVEAHTFKFSDNVVGDNDWLDIGDAADSDSGYIMPLDGTVVMATAHTEDANSSTYDLDLYINGVDNGAIATLTGASGDSDSDPTLDLDFSAGDKLRVRGDRTAGSDELGDTVVAVMVRWRS